MPTYTVRTVIRLVPLREITKKYLYEERITAWNTDSSETAIDLVEKELNEEDAIDGHEALDLFQSFRLFDEINLIPNGTEVFSLLRKSDIEPDSCINSFFDTGLENQSSYIPSETNGGQSKAAMDKSDPRFELFDVPDSILYYTIKVAVPDRVAMPRRSSKKYVSQSNLLGEKHDSRRRRFRRRGNPGGSARLGIQYNY
jgi:hypothetical protein